MQKGLVCLLVFFLFFVAHVSAVQKVVPVSQDLAIGEPSFHTLLLGDTVYKLELIPVGSFMHVAMWQGDTQVWEDLVGRDTVDFVAAGHDCTVRFDGSSLYFALGAGSSLHEEYFWLGTDDSAAFRVGSEWLTLSYLRSSLQQDVIMFNGEKKRVSKGSHFLAPLQQRVISVLVEEKRRTADGYELLVSLRSTQEIMTAS